MIIAEVLTLAGNRTGTRSTTNITDQFATCNHTREPHALIDDFIQGLLALLLDVSSTLYLAAHQMIHSGLII